MLQRHTHKTLRRAHHPWVPPRPISRLQRPVSAGQYHQNRTFFNSQCGSSSSPQPAPTAEPSGRLLKSHWIWSMDHLVTLFSMSSTSTTVGTCKTSCSPTLTFQPQSPVLPRPPHLPPDSQPGHILLRKMRFATFSGLRNTPPQVHHSPAETVQVPRRHRQLRTHHSRPPVQTPERTSHAFDVGDESDTSTNSEVPTLTSGECRPVKNFTPHSVRHILVAPQVHWDRAASTFGFLPPGRLQSPPSLLHRY